MKTERTLVTTDGHGSGVLLRRLRRNRAALSVAAVSSALRILLILRVVSNVDASSVMFA